MGMSAFLKRISPTDQRLRKHFYPEPRLCAGLWLANHGLATAMMDLSDGLSSDLPKLCHASRVGARITQRNLPSVKIAENHRKKFDVAELALHGGDDYELLFTAPQASRGDFGDWSARRNVIESRHYDRLLQVS